MAPNTKPLTDTEREQRRQAQRRQLEDALSALLSSEGWRRWLTTRATLHAYSPRNTLLIAHQAFARGMAPTHVAGFRAWLKLRHCVRKGERGLTIWAPMRVKAHTDNGERNERKTIFRTAAVFDTSQTDPLPDVEPAPLTPPSLGEIEGNSHIGLILEALARGLGYRVIWTAELPARRRACAGASSARSRYSPRSPPTKASPC